MTQTNPHPTLSQPTIAEVAFNLRFEGSTTPEDMYNGLKAISEVATRFPQAQKRSFRQVAVTVDAMTDTVEHSGVEEVDPDPFEPLYKLLNESGDRTFWFSQKAMGYASITYPGWSQFRKELEFVLNVFHRVSGIQQYSFIGLGYRNRIPWDEGAERRIIQPWLLPQTPPIPDVIEAVGTQKENTYLFSEGLHNISLIYPAQEEVDGPALIFLNIQHYLDYESPTEAQPNALLDWLEIAHERIFQSFQNSLMPEFLEARK